MAHVVFIKEVVGNYRRMTTKSRLKSYNLMPCMLVRVSGWELNSLDVTVCNNLIEKGGYESLPTWSGEQYGWAYQFTAVPRNSRNTDEKSCFIRLRQGPVEWVNSATPLRIAIKSKATRYGKMDKAFVVAVNMRDHTLDEIDITNALFGDSVIQYEVGPEMNLTTQQSRRRNGVWIDKSGEQNTRVSAVLVGTNVNPFSIASARLKIYLNPWASSPYGGPLLGLPRSVPQSNSMTDIEGEHPRKVFNLDVNWPGSIL